MSEERRPEGTGNEQSGESSGGTTSGGAATRRQPQSTDARLNNSPATGSSSGGGGGGGGRHGSRRRHRGGEREGQAASSSQRRTEASINMEELRELADLITSQGFTEFEMEKEGFRLRLSRNTYTQAAPPTMSASGPQQHGGAPQIPSVVTASAAQAAEAQAAAAQASATTSAAAANVNMLTSPIVGTFYSAPAPDAPPYVEVGSRVRKGQILCIIEAMKLMNEIESEWDGVIKEIFPQNAQAVEFGEQLFAIEPA